MKKIAAILSGILLGLSIPGHGQSGGNTQRPSSSYNSPISMPLPLFDYPFNAMSGYRQPGMGQSLYLSKDITQLAHSLVVTGFYVLPEDLGRGKKILTIIGLGIFDYVYLYLPPGASWLHEEWHRAVMGHRNIKSYNGVYDYNLFTDSISVSRVRDEDLVKLKRNHPHDFIRLSAAGNEAEIELSLEMRKDTFFSGRPIYYDNISWWFNLVNVWSYIKFCSTPAADNDTDRFNRREGSNVPKRDFTGLDFTAWVYDLFRPEEPYTARGVHPSGVGIDRYIKYSDLTGNEKRYLRLQGRLALLNFISPQMIGYNRFSAAPSFLDRPAHWNFAVVHHLTSFGYTVNTNFFLATGMYRWTVAYFNYRNYRNNFPGIQAELSRFPMGPAGLNAYLTTTVGLWIQPENQKFMTGRGTPGGFTRFNLSYPLMESFEIFIQPEIKSEGWLAGSVSLERSYQFMTGINYLF